MGVELGGFGLPSLKTVTRVASNTLNPVKATSNLVRATVSTTKQTVSKTMDVGRAVSKGNLVDAFVKSGSMLHQATVNPAVIAAGSVGQGQAAQRLADKYDIGKISNETLVRIVKGIMKPILKKMIDAESLTLGGTGSSSVAFARRNKDSLVNLASAATATTIAVTTTYAPPIAAALAAGGGAIAKGVGPILINEIVYQYEKGGTPPDVAAENKALEAQALQAAEQAKEAAGGIPDNRPMSTNTMVVLGAGALVAAWLLTRK